MANAGVLRVSYKVAKFTVTKVVPKTAKVVYKVVV